MASTCIRSINRTSISSLKSFMSKSKSAANRSQSFASTPSLARSFRFVSRSPVELGCVDGCLYAKQSVMAAARLTSPLSLTSRSFSSLSKDDFFTGDDDTLPEGIAEQTF